MSTLTTEKPSFDINNFIVSDNQLKCIQKAYEERCEELMSELNSYKESAERWEGRYESLLKAVDEERQKTRTRPDITDEYLFLLLKNRGYTGELSKKVTVKIGVDDE